MIDLSSSTPGRAWTKQCPITSPHYIPSANFNLYSLDCVATAILITKVPGLVWLCLLPTQHTQTSPSHPTLRQGRCSILALCTTGPFRYLHTCDTFLAGTNPPFPSPQEGVTVCHFTISIYLYPLLICLQWYHLPAGQYSLYELGR